MAANGISTLATKQLKQEAKLALAATNRAAAGYARATLDATQLPTLYSGNTVVDNANSGGLVVGRPWTSIAYGAGLYRTFYNNGWWGIDPTWFAGKTAQNSGASSGFAISLTSGQTLWSYMWIGYFKPDTTGTWTITASGIDDSSAVWIGNNAVSAYTWDNADGKANSATIGSSFSFTKTVTAGTYYPMRVMYGNNSGPGNMALYWNSGSGANASWSGKLYYNTATNGF
jgi:hypothetical protein